jgi:3-oxoacyl-[acyl-carrier-protein] synthase II
VGESWEAVCAGRSGIDSISSFETTSFKTRIAGEVKSLDVEPVVSHKEARTMDLCIQYGLVAAREAIDNAGLAELSDAQRLRTGVAVGSGIGGIETIETNVSRYLKAGPRRVSPFFIPASITNMCAGHISIKEGFRGPNICISTACTTGTHNIGVAAGMIVMGQADVMIAGGTEMSITPMGLAGFNAARALSTRNDDPAAASRPWDAHRDGFVMAAGAGILVLESVQHAMARGAHIYALLSGFGMSADAAHITLPSEDGAGASQAMQAALSDAGISPEQVDYINAHGTSTQAGDLAEAMAIAHLFRGHDALMVSSTKSMTGHLLGAAGAVEAIFSVLAIRDGCVPPTINLDNPDPRLPDLDLVPMDARDAVVNTVLSNSFGFGGTNASLVFRKFDG